MIYKANKIEHTFKKSHKSYNARLIPNKLRELAQKGVYYESKII